MSNNAAQPGGHRMFNVQYQRPILMLPRPRDEAAHLNLTQSLQEQFGEEYRITEGICFVATSPAMWYLDPKTQMAWRIPPQPVTVVVSNNEKKQEIKSPPCKLLCCQNKPYERKTK